MVRDRVKRTKFGDHIYCQCLQQNVFQHFKNFKFALISETVRECERDEIWGSHRLSMITAKYFSLIPETVRDKSKTIEILGSHVFTVKHFLKNNLRIQSFITMEMRCFVHRHKNRLINAKYTWRSLVTITSDTVMYMGLGLHTINLMNLKMCIFSREITESI